MPKYEVGFELRTCILVTVWSHDKDQAVEQAKREACEEYGVSDADLLSLKYIEEAKD